MGGIPFTEESWFAIVSFVTFVQLDVQMMRVAARKIRSVVHFLQKSFRPVRCKRCLGAILQYPAVFLIV